MCASASWAAYARALRRCDPPCCLAPPSQLASIMSGNISMNSEYSHCRVTYTMTPPMAIGIRADSSIVMPLL